MFLNINMSQNANNAQNITNENFKKKKKKKKNIEIQEKNDKLNDIDGENKNENENDNDNEYLSAHPIHILLQAVELAQKRGAYSINEALTISQAYKIVSTDFYEK